MRKLVLGLMGAAALTFGATSANAAVSAVSASPGILTGTTDADLTFSTGYLSFNAGSPFSEWVTFTESLDGTYGFDVQSVAVAGVAATDVDFSSIWLTGTGILGSILLTPTAGSNDVTEHYALTNQFLSAGTYTIHIDGTRGNTATYTGNISFAAVPEPATWGMMLLGFGAVGFAMRRRRRPALMQVA